MWCFMRACILSLFVFLYACPQSSAVQHEVDSAHLYADLFATYQTWAASARQQLYEWTLPNGIRVVLFQIPHAAEVFFAVQCNVGVRHEKPEESGFAHMVEHMIFKGTQKLSERDLWSILSNYGISHNACTEDDCTWYYVKTDKQNYHIFFPIFADCMQNTRFDDQHFASEVKAVFQEISMRTNDLGREALMMLRKQVLPEGHPYTRDALGSKEFLASATGANMKAFYQRGYVPEKTAIVIVGNADPDDVYKQALECFGAIPVQTVTLDSHNTSAPDTATAIADAQTAFATKKMTLYRNINGNIFLHGWRVPGSIGCNPWDARCAIFVLNERMRPIVERYGFNLRWIQQEGLTDSFFMVQGYEQAATGSVIDDQIMQLACHGPTMCELAKFKATMLRAAINDVCQSEAVAKSLLVACLQEMPATRLFDYIELLDQIDTETVKAFCQHYLKPHLRAQVAVLPLPHKHQEAWEVYRKQVEAYDTMLLGAKDRIAPVEEERFAKTLAPAQGMPFDDLGVDNTFVLSNGLTVMVKRNEALPLVYGSLRMRNAEKVPRIASQTSSVLDIASSLYYKTTKMGEHISTWDEHAQFFESQGMSLELKSNGISFQGIPIRIDVVLERIGTMLMCPMFSKEQFERYVTSQVYDIVDLCKTDQNKLVNRIAHDTLLAGKAPWLLERGRQAEIWRNVTRSDVIRFYQQICDPRNFVLVLVGNIDLMTIQEKLERGCAVWQQRETWVDVTQWIPQDIVLQNPKGSIVRVRTSDERVFVRGVRVGAVPNSDDCLALCLLDIIIERELFNIREQTGLFYEIWCDLTATYVGTNDTLLRVGTMLAAPNVMIGIQKIKELFYQIAQHGITQAQLDAARIRLQNQRVMRLQDPCSLVDHLSWMASHNMPLNFVEQQCARANVMSLATVNEVASRYLDPETWTIVLAGMLPEEGGEPA